RLPGLSGLELVKRLHESQPKLPVVLMTAHGTTATAIEATKLGAYDYLIKPFEMPDLLALVAKGVECSRMMAETIELGAVAEGHDAIIGNSRPMQEIYKEIGRIAEKPVPVLIRGETGTGKELIARAIYQHSERADRPFIAVNCAAIPETLLESELFGHEKGSFTGADARKIGRFEQAAGGTIFLDEIGDMTPATQTKILRVLQSGTFERVGGNQPIQVDVRVIAATNKPLEAAVAAKQFREDLFYRLNVVRIPIPPLRERPDDIPLLVNYFLEKNARELKRPPKSVAASVIKTLEKYHWPGNVRELENAIRRAHVMAKSDAILLSDLPPEISGQSGATILPTAGVAGEAAATDAAALARQLFQWAKRDPKLKVIPAVERELVIQALKETNDNQVHAAKLLGITRATLRKRIDKFGIQRELNVK
ncbi:MAG TPA: sigma-54 dependent transcriptional regulator, partial [Verrucomicrobiae bacterium]|nr:sigma-54 dependent transcriptional regulator [Verrucomicrobiae bacterium]